MSTLREAFSKKAFVGFLVADEHVCSYACALVEGGVDVLEIGLPYSDPIADGPVIQAAAHASLAQGTTPDSVLDAIRTIRQKVSVPIILFSYYNPLFVRGAQFLTAAKTAGCDGILVVDLPFEESEEFRDTLAELGLDYIAVASPSTSLDRIKALSSHASGFLYYACRKGTTGARRSLPEDINLRIREVQDASSLPVGVGFGISTKEQAAALLSVADGFIVGSAFVEKVQQGVSPEALTQFAVSLDPRRES